MKLPSLAALILFVLVPMGCTQFPELDARETREARAADFPELLPVETLTISRDTTRIDANTRLTLEARIEALRARAALLRRTVIDPNARNRLSQQPAVEDLL